MGKIKKLDQLGLRAKAYSYLKESNDKDKKAKGRNLRRKLKFENYKN